MQITSIIRATTIVAIATIIAPVQAQVVNAQTCYVTDANAGTDLDGLLFRVNETNGFRTVVSDFNDTTQGAHGMEPASMALLDDNTLLVIDLSAGRNFRPVLMSVDLTTGQRIILSDFGNEFQGPVSFYASNIVITADGTALVSDGFGATDLRGSLMSVNLATGTRSLITDFGDASQGPLGKQVNSVIETRDGRILALDQDSGIGQRGALFVVNTATGNRSILSDFNDASQGPLGNNPVDMVELASGDIYVTDTDGGTNDAGQILRVLANGNREHVTNFGDSATGAVGENPAGIAVDASGQLIVIDSQVASMFTVNPATGQRNIVSDFSDQAQGELGLTPFDIILTGGGPNVTDGDGDTVPDEDDQCPTADNAVTVVLDNCDSNVDNVVLANGCTISQTLAEANSGDTASPTKKQRKQRDPRLSVLKQLKRDGIISRSEERAIKACF